MFLLIGWILYKISTNNHQTRGEQTKAPPALYVESVDSHLGGTVLLAYDLKTKEFVCQGQNEVALKNELKTRFNDSNSIWVWKNDDFVELNLK